MSTTKKSDMTLNSVVSILDNIPNIWSATTVESEPQKWLESWQIYKVVDANIRSEFFGFHFVGYDLRGQHGAVSSKVERFDPVKMCGITRSGRVYQLVGMPGSDPDAQYTLNGWAVRNQVTVNNATEEFIQHFEINLENVYTLSRRK